MGSLPSQEISDRADVASRRPHNPAARKVAVAKTLRRDRAARRSALPRVGPCRRALVALPPKEIFWDRRKPLPTGWALVDIGAYGPARANRGESSHRPTTVPKPDGMAVKGESFCGRATIFTDACS